MAPKRNSRPSGARATLIAFIAVVTVVALLTTTVSARGRGCDCQGGHVIYHGAYCYPSWYSSYTYWTVPISSWKYNIYCQKKGSCIYGNCWWNKIKYNGYYCYVNDYYMRTGCPTRCYSRPICY